MSKPSAAQLADIATSLVVSAGTTENSNEGAAGRWAEIADAAEALAGASITANANTLGYMLRAATALEVLSGTSGAQENTNHDGLLTRIVDAFEALGTVSTGSLALRATVGAQLFPRARLAARAATVAAWDARGLSGSVSQIDDISGHGRHLVQGTAGLRPTGSAGLTFDGVDDLIGFTAAIPTNCTIVCLVRTTNPNNFILLSPDATGNGGFAGAAFPGGGSGSSYLAGAPTNYVDGVSVGTAPLPLYTALADGRPHVFELQGADTTGWAGVLFGSWAATPAGYYVQGQLIPIAVLDTAQADYASALREARAFGYGLAGLLSL